MSLALPGKRGSFTITLPLLTALCIGFLVASDARCQQQARSQVRTGEKRFASDLDVLWGFAWIDEDTRSYFDIPNPGKWSDNYDILARVRFGYGAARIAASYEVFNLEPGHSKGEVTFDGASKSVRLYGVYELATSNRKWRLEPRLGAGWRKDDFKVIDGDVPREFAINEGEWFDGVHFGLDPSFWMTIATEFHGSVALTTYATTEIRYALELRYHGFMTPDEEFESDRDYGLGGFFLTVGILHVRKSEHYRQYAITAGLGMNVVY